MSSVDFDGANSGFQVGINTGAITTQLHVAPERPETPPHPLCTVPFRRDPDFVDRGTLLDQIREKCSAPASRIALVGLGGVGKSQLAIEYCYRVPENFPNTWVFWVHTSNAARFEQDFREIADRVRIPGRKDPKVNIFQLVGGWLSDERKGKWILVLDNVDDEFLDKAAPGHSGSTTGKVLLEYIPQSRHGSIIITSRSAAVASRMVEPRDVITIAPMHETDARLLFQKKLDVQEDLAGDEVDEIMAALEYMPLAIVQAASYIRYRSPRFSVSQYLQLFQKSDRKKLSLLDYEGGHLRRDREAHNSIMITWQITFDHLRRARPSAADLLSLMSFFDRLGIPEALLRHREDKDNHKLDLWEKGLANLSDEDSTSSHDDQFDVDMHRLVQLATLKWLEIQGQFQNWRERFLDILRNASPTSDYGNWGTLQWAALVYEAVWYACDKWNPTDAKHLARKTQRACRELLGPDHLVTLQATKTVGVVHAQAAEWEEAEFCVSRSSKRELGAEDFETLMSMHHLATACGQQGQWEEAKELHTQVLNSRLKLLSPAHPLILTSMISIAFCLSHTNQHFEALKLISECECLMRYHLGPDHPNTRDASDALAEWQTETWPSKPGEEEVSTGFGMVSQQEG
ncbi:putative kinesin [Aspergillus fijiensis CBS 313.89]|uniref:Putative kinesin n=1 Tax=Aspergillus fijiensis CBS 313.89 TaxID=1448319 RepID=A0A8G1RZ38_9EURO|nr:putative kinesin [Aspergillus fijiensis CBS 313.89]RAK81387.1 putative kinesin [Aspergillus fijiensis CBS 313.89]